MRTDTGTSATALSGASSPRYSDSISATVVSSTSFTVAPVARRTAFTSSSLARASANRRSRPISAFSRVSGACGRTRASSPTTPAALRTWLA